MAARGPRPAILLLLAACLALVCGELWNPLHDRFRKNHVDSPKTQAINNNAYCNKMMWERGMYLKYSNTFIHGVAGGLGSIATSLDDTVTKINSVCNTGGRAAGVNKQQSTKDFRLTVCMFNLWSLSYTGVSSKAKIVISCWNGLAVLFVKTVSNLA